MNTVQKMPSKLSYAKFASLLQKHGYITSALYYTVGKHMEVVFFECRLPKTQKNILVRVPDRYTMILPPHVVPRTIKIVKTGENASSLTSHSVTRLLSARGPLITADITAISVNGMCHSKFNGSIQCYHFASNMPVAEDPIVEDEEVEPENLEIVELESALERASSTLESHGVDIPDKVQVASERTDGIDLEFAGAEHVYSDEESIMSDYDESLFDSDDTESRSGDGDIAEGPEDAPSQPPQPTGDVAVVPDDVPPPPPVVDVVDGSDVSVAIPGDAPVAVPVAVPGDAPVVPLPQPKAQTGKIKMVHRSNHVVVEELDVHTGVIYVSVDLDTIHGSIATYEVDALRIYEQLDDNDRDTRIDRVAEIKKQMELAFKHLELKIQKIGLDERGMQYQLLRLTGLLQDAENLRAKTTSQSKNAMVIEPTIMEIDRVYNKTRKTAHDLNIAILRERDASEEILTNYELSISEMFDM